MSATTPKRSALFLAILMAILGPLQMTGHIHSDNLTSFSEGPSSKTMHNQANSNTIVQLEGNGIQNSDITIDVLDYAPLTDLQMSIKPTVTPTQTGFIWNDNAIWSNADATKNGTVVEQNTSQVVLLEYFGTSTQVCKVGQYQAQLMSVGILILVGLMVVQVVR